MIASDGPAAADDGLEPVDGRRTFMKKAAVGAAIATWATPTLLSSPAAAQGTDPFSVVDWDVEVAGPYPATVLSGFSTVVDANTFTLTHAGGPVGESAVTNNFPRTGLANSYSMRMGSGLGGVITITMTFSIAVNEVVFRVLDVDVATGPRVDQVDATASLAAGPPIIAATTVPGPTLLETVPNRTYQGTVAVADGTTDGDVTYQFLGPLDTVTVVFTRAGTAGNQRINIGDIHFR